MTSPNIYGQSQRNSLFLEDAAITKIDQFPGDQFIIRMQAPKCAKKALAGSFVHIQCDDKLPMRRPLSIMRSNPDDGWIEVLFKIVGEGLRALSTRLVGETVSIIGPIGNGFSPSSKHPNKLLIGGGVGIPPMIFLAETLKFSDPSARPLVIMGSEIPFPFELATSGISTDWAPAGVDSTMPLLESWNIPARLTSMSNFPVATLALLPICRGPGWHPCPKVIWPNVRFSVAALRQCCELSQSWQTSLRFHARYLWKNSWLAVSVAAPVAQFLSGQRPVRLCNEYVLTDPCSMAI